jgi:hypothetical protein
MCSFLTEMYVQSMYMKCITNLILDLALKYRIGLCDERNGAENKTKDDILQPFCSRLIISRFNSEIRKVAPNLRICHQIYSF